MIKFIEDLTEKLNNLYCTYEMYTWNNDNTHLYALMQDNSINFTLLENSSVRDEFILTFEEKEHALYKYICARLMISMFGDVMIFNKENTIYNTVHRSNIHLVANDYDVLECFKDIIELQKTTRISKDMQFIRCLYDDIPLFSKIPEKGFLQNVDKRIDITKKLLRR